MATELEYQPPRVLTYKSLRWVVLITNPDLSPKHISPTSNLDIQDCDTTCLPLILLVSI
jgi:hypothetical protein